MMSQTHISYTGWQQPEVDVIPGAMSWMREIVVRLGPNAKAVNGQKRFLEKDGMIVIDAPDFARAGSAGSGASYEAGKGPMVEYDIALGATGEFSVAVYASPSLDVLNRGGLRYAVSIDDGPPVIADLMVSDANKWEKAVADNIRIAVTPHQADKAGTHTVRVWGIDPGVVIQRIIITRGELPRSKLGPVSFTTR